MKKIFSSISILSFWLINSQTNVHYRIIPIEDNTSKVNQMIKEISPNYEALCENIDFILSVTDKESFFIADKKTIPDDSGVNMILGASGYTGLIIQKKDSIFRQSNFDQFGKKYIVTDTIQSNWKLLNESKEIMGYKCFKAEIQNTISNPNGAFKNIIYAWYCPLFPYDFGPIGYGKLPGLIFELQTKKVLYGITKIETNKEITTFPSFDKNSEKISKKDLNQLIQKLHQQRVDMMKEQNKK